MLGVFNLLTLLKGWDYRTYEAKRSNVVRGADPLEILRLDQTGWLIHLIEFTTDAYGKVIVDYQGAKLETQTIEFYPELLNGLGAFAQDPAGWVQRYFRPNPYSTGGYYSAAATTSGWQGNTIPYVPTIVVKLQLPVESTEDSAYIMGQLFTVAIINKKAFIGSLRRILDAKSSLKIDPAILAIGPAMLEDLEAK